MNASFSQPRLQKNLPGLALIWKWSPGTDNPWGCGPRHHGSLQNTAFTANSTDTWARAPYRPKIQKKTKVQIECSWLGGPGDGMLWKQEISWVPVLYHAGKIWRLASCDRLQSKHRCTKIMYNYLQAMDISINKVCVYTWVPSWKEVHQVDINIAKSKRKRRNQESESKLFCLQTFQIRVTWPIRNTIYQRVLETARWGKACRILSKDT